MVDSKVKIQINSLEAIERLIGGNSDIEVEIRNNVADGFEKKYLKGLAEASLKRIHPWFEELRATSLKMIEQEIGRVAAWGSSSVTLSSEFKQKIVVQVKQQIEAEVQTAIKQLWVERKDLLMADVQVILKKEIELYAIKLAQSDPALREAVRVRVAELVQNMKI
jgi:hypothetical protein